MAEVDSLELKIQSDANSAIKALDGLIQKLELAAQKLNIIGSSKGLDDFAKKAANATKGLSNIKNVARDVSANIQPQIQKTFKSLDEIAEKYKDLGKGFKITGSTATIQKQIDSYSNALERAKLKKEELETGGKTGGQAYEDAIKNVQKYTNILEGLNRQLDETQSQKITFDTAGVEDLAERLREQIRQSMEGIRIENPIDITSLSDEDFSLFLRLKAEMEDVEKSAVQMGEQITESVSIPESNLGYNAEAMAAVFGEAANNIQNWTQATQKFGEQAGEILNNLPQPQIDVDGISETELSKLEEKLSQLKIPEIREENLDKLQKKLEKTENRLDELRTKLVNDVAMGDITASVDDKGFVQLRKQITLAEKQTEALREKISQLETQTGNVGGLKQFSAAFSKITSVGTKVKTALSGTISTFGKIGSTAKKALSGVAGLGKSFLNLGKSTKKTNLSLAGGLKTVLKYAIGVEGLLALINKMRAVAQESFKNLAQYSGEANTSLSMLQSSLGALKNSLSVAFAPIVNVVAPYLSMFIDMLTQVFNKVGQFFSALTGKTFAVQAKKNFTDYAAGVSKAGSAAKKAGKEAKAALRPFDELKTISMPDADSGTSGGAGGGAEISPADMFTTVPIEESIKEFADKVSEKLSKIFDVFEQAWESKGKSVVNSAKSALSSLAASALSVGNTFYDVFTNGTGLTWLESSLELLRSIFDIAESISTAFSTVWNSGAGFENVTALFTMFTNINGLLTSIGDSFSRVFSNGTGVKIWKNTLGIITGVYNTIGNIAKSLQTAWDTAGLGDSIWQGILNIVNIILGTIHNIADSTAEWAAQLDFVPLLTSIDTLFKALEPLTENIGAGLEWFWNNVLLPIGSWTIQEAVPAFLDMLSAAIEALNAIIEVFKPLGEWLWNELLLPLGQWTGEAIISGIQTITDLLSLFTTSLSENENAVNTLTAVTDTLTAAWERINEVLAPFEEFLRTVLADTWNNIISPALTYLSDTVIPKVTSVFENLWNNVLVPLGSFIADVLKPVIKILSDVLTILWKNVVVPLAQAIGTVLGGAFEVLVTLFEKTVIPVWKALIEVIKFLWNNVLSPVVSYLWDNFKPIFESVFETIGGIIDGLKQTFSGLVDFITGVFSGDWEKAWNGVTGIFKGIFNQIGSIVEGVINAVIGMINFFLRKFNGVTNKLGDVIGVDITIPEIPKVELPKLATGGIVYRPTILEAGEAGAEAILPLTNRAAMRQLVGDIVQTAGVDVNSYYEQGNKEEVALLRNQNQLLRRQIDLLEEITRKEFGISKNDVGKAARDYSREYFNRTGKPAYDF